MNILISKRLLGRAANDQEAPIVLDEFANTASAGSIIAFSKYHKDLVAGSVGVICSFGAGYSIGSLIIKKRWKIVGYSPYLMLLNVLLFALAVR